MAYQHTILFIQYHDQCRVPNGSSRQWSLLTLGIFDHMAGNRGFLQRFMWEVLNSFSKYYEPVIGILAVVWGPVLTEQLQSWIRRFWDSQRWNKQKTLHTPNMKGKKITPKLWKYLYALATKNINIFCSHDKYVDRAICLADPGEARGCSTNTSVTHWLTDWLSDPLVKISLRRRHA